MGLANSFKKKVIVLLILQIFITQSFAQFNNAQWATVFGILLVLFLCALGYIIAYVFHMEKFEILIKEELVYIGVFFALAVLLNILFSIYAANQIQGALNFLYGLENRINILVRDLNYRSVNYMVNSASFQYIGLLIWGGSGSLRGSSADNRAKHYYVENVLDLTVPALISVNLQKILLQFVANRQLLQWALECALIMKLVPGLREVANAIVGLLVVAYLIIPQLYVGYIEIYRNVNDYLFTGQVSDQNIQNQFLLIAPNTVECIIINDASIVPYDRFVRDVPDAYILPNFVMGIAIIGVLSVMKGMRLIDRWVEGLFA